MKYKLGKLILGDLTDEMFISVSGHPFYKDTLIFNSEETLIPYGGKESVRLTDVEFNNLTRKYFQRSRNQNGYST